MSRVFVTHATTRRGPDGNTELVNDYAAAERFGDVKFLTRGRLDWTLPGAFHPFDVLRDFDPAADYLAPAGDPTSTVAAILALQNVLQLGDVVRLLIYDNRSQDYGVVGVPITA